MALSSLSNVENILLLKVYLSSILPQNTILLEILLKVKTIFFCPQLPLHMAKFIKLIWVVQFDMHGHLRPPNYINSVQFSSHGHIYQTNFSGTLWYAW